MWLPDKRRNSLRARYRFAQRQQFWLRFYPPLSFLPWKVRLPILALWNGTLLIALGLAISFAYFRITLPDPLSINRNEKTPVVRILASDGSVLAERGAPADYLPFDMLPPHVTAAVVATEDRRFYRHWGIDPMGLIRALIANAALGYYAQGGSTITQQLAKILFLSTERTLARKLEELVLALYLEMRLEKREILELYLNRAYFGAGAYGIEAAAQRYFNKSCRELSLTEAALLAGLLKAPSRYAPSASPGLARTRARQILKRMLAAGVIDAEQERAASLESVRFAVLDTSRELTGAEYVIDFILEHLPPLSGTGNREVIVETTIDAALQRKAQAVVRETLARTLEETNVGQAAVLVMDVHGGIRAMVGGKSYADSQFNRATKARRQPGSAFKPFVYLAALEHGVRPDTIVQDLPISIGGWSPRNESGKHAGSIPLRQALAQSINTVAVRLQQQLGARRLIEAATRLGIKSELRDEPSLALGTSEVTLLELTAAYSVFANGGSAVAPHAIKRVRLSSGRVVFARAAPASARLVATQHVGAMNDMLHGAINEGTGRRAVLAKHPVAGKTGTSQEYRDAWFIGYTAHLAGGIWVGNDDSRPMTKVMGGGLPAQMWREIMQAAHEGRAPQPLPGTPAQEVQSARQDSPPARPTAPRAASEPAPAARGPLLPADRIDDAFVARVLEGSEGNDGEAERAAADRANRLEGFRPDGMMSLGARRP